MVNSLPSELQSEYPFEGKICSLKNKINLHYLDEGEGDPIVMVHGNPTWSFYYRNLVKDLRNQYRIIVPDHIGCGLSDKPQDYEYTLENHIDNLEYLIDSLNLKNINLIVHDWGGAIGFGYATRRPENIKKVVILNTAAFTSEHIPARINICKTPILGEFFIRQFNGFAYPATFMAVKKKLDSKIKQGYLYPYNNYKNRIATAKFVQDIPMNTNHPTYKILKGIEDKLSLIKAEKMILWGKEDFCFNDHFYKRWLEIYPEAKSHVFPNAGHYILEDEKHQVSELVQSFLGKKQ